MANEPVYRPSVRPGGADPATRRLAIVAGAIGVVLFSVIGGWSLLAHHPAGIPVIGPPPGPLKVRPANAGGLQVLGAEPPPAADGGTETLGPPPEQADPARLAAELARAHDAASPPPAASAPAPAATVKTAAPASAPSANAGATGRPAAGNEPEPPPAANQAPTATPSGPAAPAATGAPSEVAGAAGRTLPLPAAPSVAPPAADAGSAPTGRIDVQLAALGSDAAARAEWHRLATRAPSLFGDRTPAISSVERAGHTWYRVRTGPFATVAAATEFCVRVHASGVACDVATF